MSWWIFAIIPILAAIYAFESWSGKKAQRKRDEEVERIKSLPNYRRLVSLKTNGREYVAAIAEWDKKPGFAEIWCIEGPNPDGYTYHFLWPHDELEFLT